MTNKEPECVALKRRGAEHVAQLLSKKPKQSELNLWSKRTELLRSIQKQYTSTLESHSVISEKQTKYNSK
jgi:hypothetical protein